MIPTYDLMKYSDNYFKIQGSLWQHYRDDTNSNRKDSESLESKIKKQEQILMMVVLKMLK